MGQPEGGFPQELQEVILKDKEPLKGRPGARLPEIDWNDKRHELKDLLGRSPSEKELISSAIYPKVFRQYVENQQRFGDLSCLPSHVFFYGLKKGEECEIELEEGRNMIVKYIGNQLTENGRRSLTFEVNGQRREVLIEDKNRTEPSAGGEFRMAGPEKPGEVGAAMPGTVGDIKVSAGDFVEKGDTIILLEAMKMETEISAPVSGEIKNILVAEGENVENKQLLAIISE